MSDEIPVPKKLMFESFEEYAEIAGIPPTHPHWNAYKIIWRMSRTPKLVADEDGKLRVEE